MVNLDLFVKSLYLLLEYRTPKFIGYGYCVEDEENTDKMYGLLFSGKNYIHLTMHDLILFLEKYGNFQKIEEIKIGDSTINYFSNSIDKLFSVSRPTEIYLKVSLKKDKSNEEFCKVCLGKGYSTEIFDEEGKEVYIEGINSLPDNYLNPEIFTHYLLLHFVNEENTYII